MDFDVSHKWKNIDGECWEEYLEVSEKLAGGLSKLHKEKSHKKEAKSTVGEEQRVGMQCEQQTEITFLLNH